MYEEINAYVKSLIAQSSPERTAWNIENMRNNRPASWNYIDGCMMTALLSLSEITGDPSYAEFADSFIDSFVNEDGSIRTFEAEKHTLDDINEGRVLFPLYENTGKEKYRRGADTLYRALQEHPRTPEGNFWHKTIYPNQVWLDGVYMAMPFLALYEKYFGRGDYSDVLRQVETVRAHMRDDATGLYYHGYDASRSAFWADPRTGLSRSFWLRSIGWFAVALADLAQLLPEDGGRKAVGDILADLMASVWKYRDPETSMYYQVPDKAGEAGNYLESSGSAMLAYAMLKGARLGVLDPVFADRGQATFDGIGRRYLSFEDGKLHLGGICLVAGLGPEDNRRRDGSYAYYISEPVVANDAKGVAPFVLCYTEVKRRDALRQ
jgi:unsaturated rhamnogalacturonyl hydrolase